MGRLFTVLAVIMVCIWCMKENVDDDKYLGGIEFYNHDKIFNLHPMCMVISMLLCMGLSMTSFRDGWSFKVSKYLHLNFNLLAKVFMIVGLRSAYIYRNEPQGKNSEYHYQHFGTMHSWMGLTTSVLLFQQDLLGGLSFLYPRLCHIPRSFIKGYKEYHAIMGKASYIMAAIAMLTGIVAKNEHQSCVTPVSDIDQNPFDGYNHMAPGCQLSTGLGLVIVISMFFMLFALRHPLTALRDSMGAGLSAPLLAAEIKTDDPQTPSLYTAPRAMVKENSFDRKSFM